jgi:hypothetical protein
MNEQQERSAFEAELFGMYEFYSDRPHFERYTDGDYIDSRTHKFWRIWQARAALAANVPQYSDLDDLAHELWAVAQLPPGQGITDGVERIKAVLLAARGLAANVPADLIQSLRDLINCFPMILAFVKEGDRTMLRACLARCREALAAYDAAAPDPEADHFPDAGKLVDVAPAQAQQPEAVAVATLIGMAECWEKNAKEAEAEGWHTQASAFHICAADARRAVKMTAGKVRAKPEAQQPKPLTDGQIEAIGHRKAWRYKRSSDPAHSSTYTFNRVCLLDFTRAAIDSAHGIGASGEAQ